MGKSKVIDLHPAKEPQLVSLPDQVTPTQVTPAQVVPANQQPIKHIDFLADQHSRAVEALADFRRRGVALPVFRKASECREEVEKGREIVDWGEQAAYHPELLFAWELLERDTRASEAEICQHMELLIGAYPKAAIPKPEIYGGMLVEDLGSLRPTSLELEIACRSLRTTKVFVPAIAEIYAAVKAARKLVDTYRETLKSLFGAQERNERHLHNLQSHYLLLRREEREAAEAQKQAEAENPFLHETEEEWMARITAEEEARVEVALRAMREEMAAEEGAMDSTPEAPASDARSVE